MLISVDLPAPFSPSKACTSPRRRSKSIRSFALTPGKRFVIPRSSRTGASSAMTGNPKGRDRARPLEPFEYLGRRRLDLARGDHLLDLLDPRDDICTVGLGQLLAELAVANAAVLDAVVLVVATPESRGVRLVGLDRLEDGPVDKLRSARQNVPPEIALVGVDADAPNALLLGSVEPAEPTLAGGLEHDAGAARDLVQRRLLALRLVGEGRVVRVVDEHGHLRIRLLRAGRVAGEEADDRVNLAGAHGADDLLALVGMPLDLETRDVADEVSRLLLLELDPADVRRLRLKIGPIDVDPREFRVREAGCHGIQRSESEQDADRDHQAVALLGCRSEIWGAVVRRLRDEHTPVDLELLFRPQQADVRQVVESLVVEPADVGDDRDLDRRLLFLAGSTADTDGRGGEPARDQHGSRPRQPTPTSHRYSPQIDPITPFQPG